MSDKTSATDNIPRRSVTSFHWFGDVEIELMPPETPEEYADRAERTIAMLAGYLRREVVWHEKQAKQWDERCAWPDVPVSIRQANLENAEWHRTRAVQIGQAIHLSKQEHRKFQATGARTGT